MQIRVISGAFGGRRLDTPPSRRTHPMGDRVRSALFNSIASDLEDATVLDAFAGTGSLGIEALSRGAKTATFIEKDKVAQNVLAGNIASLGLEERTRLIRTTVNNWLETAEPEKFDIIFVDPPYHDPQFSTAEKLLGLLKPNGLMVLSHPGRSGVPTKTGIVVVDNRSYGNAHLTFFRRDA